MPVPTETLLRAHDLPVPTQTVLGWFGSIVTAPIDCVYLSKIGLNVVPPFSDFQTPPEALPTYKVRRLFSMTASMAATRPLITPGPIFRACRFEKRLESTLTESFC